jgi:hypothetical protein
MAKSRALIPNALRPWPPVPSVARVPEFITRLYVKRFGRLMPDEVRSIEEIAALQRAKKRAKKQARKDRKAAAAGSPQTDADRRDERSAGVVPEAALKLKPHVPTH